jgi:hypothetical protein
VREKPLVRNASNEEQLKEAKRKESADRMQAIADMRKVVSSPEGKRVLEKIIAFCKPTQSIWNPSAAIHRDAGRQEVGHLILSMIVEADRAACATMLTEAYERALEGDSNDV